MVRKLQTATDFWRGNGLQLLPYSWGKFTENFLVFYNYSIQMGDVRFDNGGFIQITLGYNSSAQSEKKIRFVNVRQLIN